MSFAPQLAALDTRIEREILRLRARYQLSVDEFRGLYISDEHVDRLVSSAQAFPTLAWLELPPITADAARADSRWRRLVDAFALTPLEQDLLLIALAPELDLKYETLYAYLNDDVTRKWPTVDLARRLLGPSNEQGQPIDALSPGGRLRQRQLIQMIPSPAGRPSLLNAGYAVRSSLAHWLLGRRRGATPDHAAVTWTWPDDLPVTDGVAQKRALPLLRLLEGHRGASPDLPAVALIGRRGSGRRSIAVAAAIAACRPLVRLDVRGLTSGDADAADALASIGVLMSLEPAIALIDLEAPEGPATDEAARARFEVRLDRGLAQWPSSTLLLFRADDDDRWRTSTGGRRVVELRCEGDAFSDQLSSWRDGAEATSMTLADADVESLAGQFALSRGQVRASLATARDLAAMSDAPAVGTSHIGAAARLASDRSLGRLATKVERTHDWSDLVLPAITLRRLREFGAAIRHRHRVYDDWGFQERLKGGSGLKALFAGASGTGKTMAAGIVARDLGLELYKIDLAAVVSKYIGETEKNLDRIFRAARASRAIVFLDEAEALMGKRSEVKDAHDRYANIEVAYLLQKLEDHDGIVILATNLKRNIDDAFNRRMQYVIDFPRPDQAERERIWRGMFPRQAPIGADVDFGFLARQFELAGGDIRNVVLDAAFLAADDGGVIGMSALVDALVRQLSKEGKTPTGADFREYQRLVPRITG